MPGCFVWVSRKGTQSDSRRSWELRWKGTLYSGAEAIVGLHLRCRGVPVILARTWRWAGASTYLWGCWVWGLGHWGPLFCPEVALRDWLPLSTEHSASELCCGGLPGCWRGFLSSPTLDEKGLWTERCCYPRCTLGLESVGGWLLRVVSAEAPGRSYVNICAELSGVETELTVALGSGEEEWGGSRRASLEACDGVSVGLFSAQRWLPVLFDLRGSKKALICLFISPSVPETPP